MKAKSLLLEILEDSRSYEVSYTDFFLLFMRAYGYLHNESLMSHRDVVDNITAKIKKLAKIIAKLPDTLNILKSRVLRLSNQGLQPFLVDCLGLPEIYEIYRQVVKRCGILSVVVELYVNTKALTYRFRGVFEEPSMVEVAKLLGTSLYKHIDMVVHHELGKPVEPYTLVKLAETRFKIFVDELARDAINKRYAFIVADHGYDIYCENHRYYLGHGRDAKFAKIAPLIIVNCNV